MATRFGALLVELKTRLPGVRLISPNGAEIVDLARMDAPEGLEVLLSIMRSPEARDADRLAAVRELLERGYGRPSVSIVVHAAEEAPSDLRPVIESMSEEGIRRFLGMPPVEPVIASAPVRARFAPRPREEAAEVILTPILEGTKRR